MSFLDCYRTEIRNRSTLLIFSWLTTAISIYANKEICLYTISSSISPSSHFSEGPYFISTSVGEIFSVYVYFAVFASNQVLLLNSLYHTFVFLSPGLYKREYIKTKLLFLMVFLVWWCSLIALNKFIFPVTWSFFLDFTNTTDSRSVKIFFEAKLYDYFEYYILLYNTSLINCLFMLFLGSIVIYLNKTLSRMTQFRKLVYFTFAIFSTVTTPPDIFSQIFTILLLISSHETFLFVRILLDFNRVTS